MEHATKEKANKFPQYFAALVVSLGGFTLGTSIGWTSTAEAKILAELSRPLEQVTWIGSLLHLGGASIMLPLPFVLNRLGRKTVMLIAIVPLVLSWVITCVASQIILPTTAIVLYCVGQYLAGMCEAIFCVVVPVFICEIGQKEMRGRLASFFELLLSSGIFFAYVVGSLTTILGLSIACGVIPIIFGLLLLFIPETPYYFMMKNKPEKATESLEWFRGKDYCLRDEINDIEKTVTEMKQQTGSFKQNLARPGTKKSLVIGIGAISCQHFGGINAVSLHMKLIFEMTGSTISPDNSLLIIGALQILSTAVAALIVDRAGRKPTLFASMSVMGACHVVLGTYFIFYDRDKLSVEFISWLPLVTLCIFFLAYSFGAGPVAWTIMGEIFPNEIKNIAVPITIFLSWVLGFIFACTYHFIVQGLGRSGPFWIYAIFCFCGAVFALFVCIETKGKTFLEIQFLLAGGQSSSKIKTEPLELGTNDKTQ